MRNTTDDGGQSAPQEPVDDVGTFIRLAGARENVEPQRLAAAHGRVSNHWQSVVRDRRRVVKRRWLSAAMAAGLLLSGFLGLLLQPWDAAMTTDIATVNRVLGEVTIDGRRLVAGDAIPTGARIDTGEVGRMALDLPDGQRMRIDQKTLLVALGDSRYRLHGGGVYVESDDEQPTARVFVETRYGVAYDIGTRFQVRVGEDGLSVGVRDGRVEIERPDSARLAVAAGEILQLASTGGPAGQQLDENDDYWAWIEDIAPRFDIDGRSLLDYLKWYVEQEGAELRWAEHGDEERARDIRLSGSIDGLSLQAGFQTVSRIAPFTYQRAGQALIIGVD